MPTYVYVNEKDERDVVEKIYPASKYRHRRKIDGKWYVVSTALQARGMATAKDGYPYWSEAMAINPKDIPECQQVFMEAGIGPQKFDKMGCIRVRDWNHRRQLMKARGFVDRNSYTGY